MNLLYLADLNSIHDIKWISFFAERDHRCYVLQRRYHFEKFNLNSIHQNIYPVGMIEDYSSIKPWKNRKWKNLIQEIIRANEIDIFHILYAEPNVLWALAIKSIPVILTTRGTDVLHTLPNTFSSRSLLNRLVKRNYARAFKRINSITSTSIKQKNNIIKLTGFSGQMEVIRTGVDVELIFEKAHNHSSKWAKKNFILFPRKMTPTYNHELSIMAIDLLSKEIKDEYEMIFVDNDSYDKNYVERIRSMMKSMQGVKFKFLPSQPQDQIWEMYNYAKLVVMNPKTDGSPVSALEAMVLEKPLILGNADYDRELFEKVTKLKTEDPKELSDLMIQELNDPTNYDGFRIVSERANRKSEMNRLFQLYEQATSN